MSESGPGVTPTPQEEPGEVGPGLAAEVGPELSLEELKAAPHKYGFFQAVRLLRRSRPDRSAVGHFSEPHTEVARFGANSDLAFPASEIHELEVSPKGPWKIVVNFIGLVGHLGVLPTHYSTLIRRRLKVRDRALRDFLDIFHHRVTSLFYRALERARFYVQYERREPDVVSTVLVELLGVAQPAALNAVAVSDLLPYAGLLGPEPRSAMALEQLVEDWCEVPATIEQFVGGWFDLSDTAQCRVDHEARDETFRLGVGALVGEEIYNPQAKARIVLGPLSLERFADFLPSGDSYASLQELTRFFANDELEFELKLLLDPDAVPPVRLGADSSPPLGWGSWIRASDAAPAYAETVLPL